jgi:hypothetical protein
VQCRCARQYFTLLILLAKKWKRIKLPIALLILRKFTCSFQQKKEEEEGSPDTLLSDFTFETQLAA